MTRPLPRYLKVVPPQAKRFRRPPAPPDLIRPDGTEIADIIRKAERLADVAERLFLAFCEKDEIAAQGVLQLVLMEAGGVRRIAENVRDGKPETPYR